MSGLPSKPVIANSAKTSLPVNPKIVETKQKVDDDDFSPVSLVEAFNDTIEERNLIPSDEVHMQDLLKKITEEKASDLHLSAGKKPMMRIRGAIEHISGYTQFSPDECRRIIFEIMNEEQRKEFEKTHELNFGYSLEGVARFRVNVYQQRGTMSVAIRLINEQIIPLEELGMPESVYDFAHFTRGLVLVTGPTGSGKSTTLASIIDKINESRPCHILTIEDPIEYIHESKKALISQREVGEDTESFNKALTNALRQDPDVILLGEMRDLETIQAALTAAETGHLVFATLHTQSAMDTVSRIIDVFPEGAKGAVRSQLSNTLQAIACQTLIRSLDGSKMVPAVEILKATGAIRSLIRKGQDEQIRTSMETNKSSGMQTLDAHLVELVKKNEIPVDEAIFRSSNADTFITALGGNDAINKIKRSQDKIGGVQAYER